MEQDLVQGTVVLYGTPAEETTSGKISIVKAGLLKENVDYSMMLVSDKSLSICTIWQEDWRIKNKHPFAIDGIYARMLALDTLDVEFFGKASHAGMAPWNGVNALDALMQGFDNIGLLRQQTIPTNR